MARRLHEIIPGLWMGGASAPIVAGDFDHVVTLCWADEERVPVPPGTAAVAWRFADADMPDAGAVRAWAGRISGWLDGGESVLVRCAAGRNRSGLVVARVLIEQGMTPSQAIATVRRRRSLDALNNERFTDWLLLEGAGLPAAVPLLPASLRIRSRRWAVSWTTGEPRLAAAERISAALAASLGARLLAVAGGGASAAGGSAGLALLVVPLWAWRRRARHEAAVAAAVAALVVRSADPRRLGDATLWWPTLAGAVVSYRGLRDRLL